GGEAAICGAHARVFLGLAEEALPFLRGCRQAAWLRRLEEERGNLRAALEWSSPVYPEMYARLVAALWRFWYVRGYLNEGRRWMEAALAPEKPLPAGLRAKVCYGAAALATNQGDYTQAIDLSNESLALCRESGDKEGIANALDTLG